MKGRLVVLCGRTFSGKSTVAAWLSDALSATIVSLDAINAERGLWGGDGVPLEEWAHTNELARERAGASVRAGSTVIIDDTSSPRFLRDGWRELARDADAGMALVYVDTPVPVILDRLEANRHRPSRGDLTDEVLAAHLRSFEPPTVDEQPIRLELGADRSAVLSMITKRLAEGQHG